LSRVQAGDGGAYGIEPLIGTRLSRSLAYEDGLLTATSVRLALGLAQSTRPASRDESWSLGGLRTSTLPLRTSQGSLGGS